jgi:hypothetical protein
MDNELKAEIIETLKRAQKLVPLLTVRQVINAGDHAIEASGLNPYCLNEGQAIGDEYISSWWIDWAIEKLSETSSDIAA